VRIHRLTTGGTLPLENAVVQFQVPLRARSR
jgi:hypothetical protein